MQKGKLITALLALCASFCIAGAVGCGAGSDDKPNGADGFKFVLSQDGTYYIVTSYEGNETEIVIPETYNNLSVKAIAGNAFSYNGSLVSVTIPDSISSIGERAFAGMYITDIVIPKSVLFIGEKAFQDCNYLTIYCEAQSKPYGWEDKWNNTNCPVVWGYVQPTEE